MGQKIGILGGTFNPIHIGHIKLALTAYNQANLDKVIFMPSGKSYMKRELYVLPGEERLKLIELAIGNIPYFETSDIEVKREGNTYTYETLEMLKRENPTNDYYFILGADCLFSMEKWVNPQRIFDACTVIAAVRNGMNKFDLEKQADRLAELFGAQIYLLDFEEINLSSSEIRDLVKKGERIDAFVPVAVSDYIRENKLFAIKDDVK